MDFTHPNARHLIRFPSRFRPTNSNHPQRQERQIVKSWLDFGEFLPEIALAIAGLISVRSVVQVYPGPLDLRDYASSGVAAR